VRRWPVVLLVVLAAVGASALALSRREPSYRSKATLVITPLAQYDATFLGTSIIRDAGDATRTPTTVAKTIDSNATAAETARRLGDGSTAADVTDHVEVKPVADANVVEIDARAAKRGVAERLAGTYVESALAVRWRTIDAELARRIAALAAHRKAASDAGDIGQERILKSVRRSGTDPTLKLQGIDPAVSTHSLPGAAIVALALLGGLLLGALAVLGMGRFGRILQNEKDASDTFPLPVLARVQRQSSQVGFDRVAVQIEAWAPDGGTIAVASPSAGDGRTTVAKGITAAIAEGGRTATVARLELDLGPAGIDAAPPSVQQVIAEARADADFVAVDGPPLDADASALRVAMLADVVVLVVRLGSTGRRELARARDLLEQTSIRPAGLILVEPSKGHDAGDGTLPEQPARRKRLFGPIWAPRPDKPLEGARPNGTRQSLMGMPLDGLSLTEAVERVFQGLADGRGGAVFTPNLEILRQYRRTPSVRDVFDETELLVPDGMPLVWASRMQGTPVPQRVTGSDVLAGVTSGAAARGATVFFAGGHPGVAQRAADRLARSNPGLSAAAHPCYIEPGPLAPQVEELVSAIVAEAPDIVYVGLPFTGQVHLVTVLRSRLPRTWFVGVGSCFDLVNGDRPRAPKWLQRLGLEWAHRIVHEPRVWRRYLISGLPFAAHLGIHALTVRMGRRPSTPA
jgi:N-acetylglucosaminyldiphosphoundecaprenol N-acetyl-beta-D-mannosaminyltransferase